MDRATSLDIVYQAIDVVNGLRSETEQLAKTPDLLLAGEGGALDSLALVTLILAVESRVSTLAGAEIGLLDDSDFGEDAGGLRSPAALADLILERLAA